VVLLADPALGDPNFRATMILLVGHTEEGSLGLVLNRRNRVRLHEVLEDPTAALGWNPRLDWGGPVGTDRLHILFDGAGAGVVESLEVVPGLHFGGSLEQAATANSQGRKVRLFLGYSGWGEGQLESEVLEASWRVIENGAEHAFAPSDRETWRQLLAEQDRKWSWLRGAEGRPEVN